MSRVPERRRPVMAFGVGTVVRFPRSVVMDVIYINLDRQAERRTTIENSFRECVQPGWSLARFPAIDTRYITSHGIPGTLSDSAKACVLSHKALLEGQLSNDESILVLEDDAIFSPLTFPLIDEYLASPQPVWDLLFTDICVPNPKTWFDLVQVGKRIKGTRRVATINLSRVNFAGSTAYIVNGSSKRKLFAFLDEQTDLNIPYDLLLRKWIYSDRLKAWAFYPFLTGLSDASDVSQIQCGDMDISNLVWNTFRKNMWIGRSDAALTAPLEALQGLAMDPQCRVLGALFALAVSERFPND